VAITETKNAIAAKTAAETTKTADPDATDAGS
jgi:hypothetical protein